MVKPLFRIGLSIGVSLAILALLLKMFTTGLPESERPSILIVLQATSPSLLLGFFGVLFISLLVRAYRYRLLIELTGEQNVPSMRQMVLVTGIRNMVVDLLPARLGELGYVGLLNRGYGVKLQHCISSLSLSIALDFVALFSIAIFIVAKQMFSGGVTGWAVSALILAAMLSIVALVGLFLITPWFVKTLIKARPGWLVEGTWRSKLVGFLQDINLSLQSVWSSGKAGHVVAVSILIRILKYFGFYLLFQAVASGSFVELSELPVEHIISALIGGEVGSSLPIPAFMSFGVYEAGSALVFQLLGVGDQAATFITMLCVHIWSQAFEYLVGGVFIVIFLLLNRKTSNYATVGSAQTNPKRSILSGGANYARAVMIIIAGSVLMAGGLFLTYQLWSASKLGAFSAPSAGGVASNIDDWLTLSQQHTSKIDGFIVFSSNRDGNHDIFRRDLKTFKLDKITRHPHTETYPRISPNGKRIVFARAHQEWVSQRNTVAWDIYLLDLTSLDEIKIASNSTAPHWLNNSEITYLHNSDTVERVNVDTLISSVIFQTGSQNMMPKGARLQNPKFNDETKQLVFTARQSNIGSSDGHWGTAIDTSGKHRAVLEGCELAWSSDNNRLYQVNPNGADGTVHIVSVDPQTLEHRGLINLAGEFTHEYWPKDSSNGAYMVFGASRGNDEHEHDTEDYEIFLWQLGSEPDSAIRITFHTGNDNWPDVYIAN